MPSDAEKLREVEGLIQDFRCVRNVPDHPRYAAYVALKAIAEDIRGRQTDSVNGALCALDEAMTGMIESPRSPVGYEVGKMVRVAQELKARWPTVRQALEAFSENGWAHR